jgi:hypothetical protein
MFCPAFKLVVVKNDGYYIKKKENDMKKYSSLFKRSKDQQPKDVYGFFFFNHQYKETWETPFMQLASLARKEEWAFSRTENMARYSNQKIPILTNYLNYTFMRLQEEGKIVVSDDHHYSGFNTGLQTKHGKDIIALFIKNVKIGNQYTDYIFDSFVDTYSSKCKSLKEVPQIANYIIHTKDLVFDVGLSVEINDDHIVNDNIDRLPQYLRDKPGLALNAIKGAMDKIKQKILRNYKIAIPSWYNGHMQLLLPLSVADNGETDVALVAEKDKVLNRYLITTILSMDMAYLNARLITKPDRDWLNP